MRGSWEGGLGKWEEQEVTQVWGPILRLKKKREEERQRREGRRKRLRRGRVGRGYPTEARVQVAQASPLLAAQGPCRPLSLSSRGSQAPSA